MQDIHLGGRSSKTAAVHIPSEVQEQNSWEQIIWKVCLNVFHKWRLFTELWSTGKSEKDKHVCCCGVPTVKLKTQHKAEAANKLNVEKNI